jgi:hypothetical protein
MDADLAKPLVPSTARLNILRKLCSNTSLSKHESSLLKAVAVIGLGGIVVGYNVGLVAGGFLKEGSLNFTISATVQDLIVAILYVGRELYFNTNDCASKSIYMHCKTLLIFGVSLNYR